MKLTEAMRKTEWNKYKKYYGKFTSTALFGNDGLVSPTDTRVDVLNTTFAKSMSFNSC